MMYSIKQISPILKFLSRMKQNHIIQWVEKSHLCNLFIYSVCVVCLKIISLGSVYKYKSVYNHMTQIVCRQIGEIRDANGRQVVHRGVVAGHGSGDGRI